MIDRTGVTWGVSTNITINKMKFKKSEYNKAEKIYTNCFYKGDPPKGKSFEKGLDKGSQL